MSEPLDGARTTRGAGDTFVAALNQALHYEMGKDPTLLVMGEDVARLGGLFRVTQGLSEAYPGRVFDTPICEGGFAGMGIGAAMAGHRVVVEIQVIDFLLLASDQIANAGNLHFVSGGQVSVPIVFRGPCGFGTGFGVTHSQHLEAIFAGRPGLKVLMPSTPADAKGLLTSAIRDPNPVVIFEDSTLYFRRGDPADDGATVPIGVARVARAGTDCTVVSAGRGVLSCMDAAEQLSERHGIETEVLDLRSLKPIDWDALETSIRKTGRFVTAFDGPGFCSYGKFLVGEAAGRWWSLLKARPVAVTGIDIAGAVARPAEALAGITDKSVCEGVMWTLDS